MVTLWSIAAIAFAAVANIHVAADQGASIWSNIAAAGSNSLYTTLQEPKFAVIQDFLSNHQNITLFLPNDAAIKAASSSGALNMTQTNSTTHALMYHVIAGTHDAASLLSARQLFTTQSPDGSSLIAGPPPFDQSTLQVLAGVITANVVTKDIECSNGIIHVIDHFLQPPVNTMDTIPTVDGLSRFNQLLTSNNLTYTVATHGKTILVPNNAAWSLINSSSLPLGTLTHDIKYEILDGIYLSSQFTDGLKIATDYSQAQLTFHRDSAAKQISVVGRSASDTANLVQTDILTKGGIIHVVDHVLSADLASDGSVDPSQTTRYQGSVPILQPASETNKPRSQGSKTLVAFFSPTLAAVALTILFFY